MADDDEILAKLQALDDDDLELLDRHLNDVVPRLQEPRPELARWFEKLQILAQDALIRRGWSLELLGDEDLVLLKQTAGIFRGTFGWTEMEGIEPFWGPVELPAVPAHADLWNTIAADAAEELDRRKAIRRPPVDGAALLEDDGEDDPPARDD